MSRQGRDRRRALGAGIRSALVPGWGQLFVGRRGSGWLLTSASVLVAAVGATAIWVLGPVELLARLTEPGALAVVLVLNAVLAVFRLVPTLHAWLSAGGRHFLLGAGLTVLVLAPHVVAGHLGLEAKQTLEAVFAAEPSASTTSTTTTTSPTTTTTTTTLASVIDQTSSTTTLPATTTTTIDVAAAEDRVNVLLLGGDAGPGRSGLRTDSVIVVSVGSATGDSAVFSLPRNWGGLTLTDGSRIPNRILNEVYEWGRRQPERFGGPDPGAAALVEVAEVLTGLDIDHFALVDLTGFAAVVDAVGGVTIDVPRSVYGPSYNPDTGGYTMIRIGRGTQTLDGAQALAYVRERYQSSDYDRMDRQRCVVAALAEGADTVSLLRGLTDLFDAFESHVTTDIPLDQLPALIRIAGRVPADDIRVMGFDNSYRRGWDSGGFAVPDPALVAEAVRDAITDPDSDDIEAVNEACG